MPMPPPWQLLSSAVSTTSLTKWLNPLLLILLFLTSIPLSTPSAAATTTNQQQSSTSSTSAPKTETFHNTKSSSNNQKWPHWSLDPEKVCPSARKWTTHPGSFCSTLWNSYPTYLSNQTELEVREARAVHFYCELDRILERFDCTVDYSVNVKRQQCSQCQQAYREWACAMVTDTLEDGQLDCDTKLMPCPSCASICHQVMRLCPYLSPDRIQFDLSGLGTPQVSQYGGHPAFYCPLENDDPSDPAYSSLCFHRSQFSSDPDYVHNICTNPPIHHHHSQNQDYNTNTRGNPQQTSTSTSYHPGRNNKNINIKNININKAKFYSRQDRETRLNSKSTRKDVTPQPPILDPHALPQVQDFSYNSNEIGYEEVSENLEQFDNESDEDDDWSARLPHYTTCCWTYASSVVDFVHNQDYPNYGSDKYFSYNISTNSSSNSNPLLSGTNTSFSTKTTNTSSNRSSSEIRKPSSVSDNRVILNCCDSGGACSSRDPQDTTKNLNEFESDTGNLPLSVLSSDYKSDLNSNSNLLPSPILNSVKAKSRKRSSENIDLDENSKLKLLKSDPGTGQDLNLSSKTSSSLTKLNSGASTNSINSVKSLKSSKSSNPESSNSKPEAGLFLKTISNSQEELPNPKSNLESNSNSAPPNKDSSPNPTQISLLNAQDYDEHYLDTEPDVEGGSSSTELEDEDEVFGPGFDLNWEKARDISRDSRLSRLSRSSDDVGSVAKTRSDDIDTEDSNSDSDDTITKESPDIIIDTDTSSDTQSGARSRSKSSYGHHLDNLEHGNIINGGGGVDINTDIDIDTEDDESANATPSTPSTKNAKILPHPPSKDSSSVHYQKNKFIAIVIGDDVDRHHLELGRSGSGSQNLENSHVSKEDESTFQNVQNSHQNLKTYQNYPNFQNSYPAFRHHYSVEESGSKLSKKDNNAKARDVDLDESNENEIYYANGNGGRPLVLKLARNSDTDQLKSARSSSSSLRPPFFHLFSSLSSLLPTFSAKSSLSTVRSKLPFTLRENCPLEGFVRSTLSSMSCMSSISSITSTDCGHLVLVLLLGLLFLLMSLILVTVLIVLTLSKSKSNFLPVLALLFQLNDLHSSQEIQSRMPNSKKSKYRYQHHQNHLCTSTSSNTIIKIDTNTTLKSPNSPSALTTPSQKSKSKCDCCPPIKNDYESSHLKLNQHHNHDQTSLLFLFLIDERVKKAVVFEIILEPLEILGSQDNHYCTNNSSYGSNSNLRVGVATAWTINTNKRLITNLSNCNSHSSKLRISRKSRKCPGCYNDSDKGHSDIDYLKLGKLGNFQIITQKNLNSIRALLILISGKYYYLCPYLLVKKYSSEDYKSIKNFKDFEDFENFGSSKGSSSNQLALLSHPNLNLNDKLKLKFLLSKLILILNSRVKVKWRRCSDIDIKIRIQIIQFQATNLRYRMSLQHNNQDKSYVFISLDLTINSESNNFHNIHNLKNSESKSKFSHNFSFSKNSYPSHNWYKNCNDFEILKPFSKNYDKDYYSYDSSLSLRLDDDDNNKSRKSRYKVQLVQKLFLSLESERTHVDNADFELQLFSIQQEFLAIYNYSYLLRIFITLRKLRLCRNFRSVLFSIIINSRISRVISISIYSSESSQFVLVSLVNLQLDLRVNMCMSLMSMLDAAGLSASSKSRSRSRKSRLVPLLLLLELDQNSKVAKTRVKINKRFSSNCKLKLKLKRLKRLWKLDQLEDRFGLELEIGAKVKVSKFTELINTLDLNWVKIIMIRNRNKLILINKNMVQYGQCVNCLCLESLKSLDGCEISPLFNESKFYSKISKALNLYTSTYDMNCVHKVYNIDIQIFSRLNFFPESQSNSQLEGAEHLNFGLGFKQTCDFLTDTNTNNDINNGISNNGILGVEVLVLDMKVLEFLLKIIRQREHFQGQSRRLLKKYTKLNNTSRKKRIKITNLLRNFELIDIDSKLNFKLEILEVPELLVFYLYQRCKWRCRCSLSMSGSLIRYNGNCNKNNNPNYKLTAGDLHTPPFKEVKVEVSQQDKDTGNNSRNITINSINVYSLPYCCHLEANKSKYYHFHYYLHYNYNFKCKGVVIEGGGWLDIAKLVLISAT